MQADKTSMVLSWMLMGLVVLTLLPLLGIVVGMMGTTGAATMSGTRGTMTWSMMAMSLAGIILIATLPIALIVTLFRSRRHA